MQLVVTLSEEDYNLLVNVNDDKLPSMNARRHLHEQLRIGIVLPKGHGRLIDVDAYRKEMLDSREFDFFKRLDMQPTIIEADQAGSVESPTPSEIRPTSLPVATVISNGQEFEVPYTPKRGTLDVSTGKFSTEDNRC